MKTCRSDKIMDFGAKSALRGLREALRIPPKTLRKPPILRVKMLISPETFVKNAPPNLSESLRKLSENLRGRLSQNGKNLANH